ncbi:MAG: GNAT family N-acetyltransferase [Chloroflexi bacterium]|nr:GNAT family N-acetyltransferase [Chloroflexota bacterium]
MSDEDVSRIARWLRDPKVSDSWFGVDPLGMPVHVGYSPQEVLGRYSDDWLTLFSSSWLKVMSVYAMQEGHVGEVQVHTDKDEPERGEVFVLIGRRALWHTGYGTAAMVKLLDLCFYTFGLREAFATVPEANTPAISLFQRLGFSVQKRQNTSRYRRQPCLTLSVREQEYQGRRLWLVEPVSKLGGIATSKILQRDVIWRVDIFKNLSREQRAKVISLSSPTRVPAGWELGKAGHPGDYLFIIMEGQAELTVHSDFGEVTVRVAQKGESLPLAALLGSGALITSITAMTEMEVLAIPRSRLVELCLHIPAIGTVVYANMAEILAGRYKVALGMFTSTTQRAKEVAGLWANV